MPSRSRRTPPDDEAPPTFEQRLAALEAVVEALEGDDLGLEESLARYREGVGHLEACRALLDDAEGRLVELLEGADGEARERGLRIGDSGLEPEA